MASSNRDRILFELVSNSPASFTELYNRVGYRKSELSYHIEKLMSSSLARRYTKKERGEMYESYYEPTTLLLRLLEGFEAALKPKVVEATEKSSSLRHLGTAELYGAGSGVPLPPAFLPHRLAPNGLKPRCSQNLVA